MAVKMDKQKVYDVRISISKNWGMLHNYTISRTWLHGVRS